MKRLGSLKYLSWLSGEGEGLVKGKARLEVKAFKKVREPEILSWTGPGWVDLRIGWARSERERITQYFKRKRIGDDCISRWCRGVRGGRASPPRLRVFP